jgi:PAS domain S-box-containing protein
MVYIEMKKGKDVLVNSTNPEDLIDGKYGINDLLDVNQLKELFRQFNKATGFTIGFLDHPGLNILIATGWRDICTKFHRAAPRSLKNCLRSNHVLLDKLKKPGQVVIEGCANGMVDCATPIIIEGKHVASLATGQLFLEKPDISRFKKQAKMFGYNEHDYLEALKDVPVVDAETLKNVTRFLGSMAVVLSQAGYARLVHEREIAERKKAQEQLRKSDEKYSTLFDNSVDAIFIADPITKQLIDCNKAAEKLLCCSKSEILSMHAQDLHPEDLVVDAMKGFVDLARGKISHISSEVLAKDKKRVPVLISAAIVSFGNKKYLQGVFRDMSEIKKIQEQLEKIKFDKIKAEEAEKFNKLAINRELKMIELKKQIRELKSGSRSGL